MKLSLKKKPFFSKEKGKTSGADDTPYLNARRTWNEHVGGVVTAKQYWQVTALGSMLVALSAVGGLIYVGGKSKFIPYVVAIPASTHLPTSYGPAEVAAQADKNVFQAELADWIASARLVTPDVSVEHNAIMKVYAMLLPGTPALGKMNEYLNGDPAADHFKRAETETQEIQISDILQQSSETWEIDWIETVRSRDGSIKIPPYKMRASITVTSIPPDSSTEESQVRANPLGLYVKDFSWSKQL